MHRILIVEPDRYVRELLELQIEYLGFELAGGAEDCDIILLEPSTARGLASARVLRARHPDLPLIFVSIRYPTAETIALRPFAHLVKPFGLRRLASALVAATEMDASRTASA
jgi:DNA-binding response OmpR family regulator